MKFPFDPLPYSGSLDPGLNRSNALFLLPSLICHAALAPADRFLALDASEFEPDIPEDYTQMEAGQ